MADKTLIVNFSIPVGKYLKLGYRPIGFTTPFTYVPTQIFYNQSPFNLVVDDTYTYELELSTICGSCGDGSASNPVYVLESEAV